MKQAHGNKILTEPQVAATLTVSPTPRANPLGTGKILIIGESEGGAPSTVFGFTDKTQATEVLRSGDALRQIGMMFNPSNQHDGANFVGFVRAQTAVQAEHDATSAKVVSKDYGTWVNSISVKIEDGTVTEGVKVTIVSGDETEVFDNLDLAMSIQYVGSESSGLLEITAGDHIIGQAGDPASEVVEFDFDLTLAAYSTLSKVVKAIDALSDWDCSIYVGAPTGIGTLDSIVLNTLAEGDAKSAALITQAYPNIFNYTLDNYSAFVNGTVETDGTKPSLTTGFEFLAGGTAPVMDTAAIIAALTLIEDVDVDQVFIDSETPANWALVTAHNQNNPFFRMSVFGGVSQATAALTKSVAITNGKLINSIYGAIVAQGIYDFKEDGSGTELLGPKFAAAKVAGLIAGQVVQVPSFNKALNVQGLEFEYDKDDREAFIDGGVICLRDKKGIGFVINQDVCTLQNNVDLWDPASDGSPQISLNRAVGQFNKEWSVGADRSFIGGNVGVGRATIVGFDEGFFKSKEASGLIAPDDSDLDNVLPAWENLIVNRLDAGWKNKVSIRVNGPFVYFLIDTIAVI